MEILIYILATWRVSSLLVNELGPWDLFMHIRELAGIEHDENKETTIIPDGFFAGVLSCVWCASLWVAGFWVAGDLLAPAVALPAATIFAISAGAIGAEKIIRLN